MTVAQVAKPSPDAPSSVSKAEFDLLNNTLQSEIKELRERLDDQQKQGLSRSVDSLKQAVDGNAVVDQKLANVLAQSEQTLARSAAGPNYWTWIGSILGAICGAIISGVIVWQIARRYTLRIKMIESTLEFSKRFGELIEQQGALNKSYAQARHNGNAPDNHALRIEQDEGKTWWWRFFDLVLYEYDFFRQGFVWDERFGTWMKWRWYEHNAQGGDVWKTNGVDYQTGWTSWKTRPANIGSRLARFLDQIHDAHDLAEVRRIVHEHSPRFWHRYHLED